MQKQQHYFIYFFYVQKQTTHKSHTNNPISPKIIKIIPITIILIPIIVVPYPSATAKPTAIDEGTVTLWTHWGLYPSRHTNAHITPTEGETMVMQHHSNPNPSYPTTYLPPISTIDTIVWRYNVSHAGTTTTNIITHSIYLSIFSIFFLFFLSILCYYHTLIVWHFYSTAQFTLLLCYNWPYPWIYIIIYYNLSINTLNNQFTSNKTI